MSYPESLIKELEYRAKQIRQESIRMIYLAQSGHPGGSLSEADILSVLYFHTLRLNPAEPTWQERDRFILSKGHACAAYYAALALRGFFPFETLRTFRQMDSILQGHPDMRKTPGVDMISGPLGSGLAAGVGMTLGARLTQRDLYVYVLIGDGDAQEGCTWEAAMFAGFHHLEHLICIYDYNRSQVDGTTMDVLSLEPVVDKWRAFNWEVIEIDGHNISQILDALNKPNTNRSCPLLILAQTTKGKGVSFMEDQAGWHGKAPNKSQTEHALRELGGTLA